MEERINCEKEVLSNVLFFSFFYDYALELNNLIISAASDNQNLARFDNAISFPFCSTLIYRYLELLTRNLEWLGKMCNKKPTYLVL